ncbi:hypothetical protein Q5762_27985 [Streptomyces sp. P9(2023)]|uniref:hypothetical protein n=1 Tax=Streptomyces sp. P9(2023) TaxID=3064394 RepID=UPI0028F443A8|nr:hypothetical protein [Streptomyces sp. P9(2023)]MDT9692102.1 hypothetical protein [Streptomyces sp. P9(2023)]
MTNSADIDAYLSGLDITITPERRAELYDRFGEEDLLDIEELAAAWAENFTHITEEHALRRIADVDELVTAHNVRTGNNVG